MENPNHLKEPNEAIPKVNPVVPEPNQVADIHDPNEMVDIPDDIDLVDYDNEDPKKDPEEDPEEEPEEDVDIKLEVDVAPEIDNKIGGKERELLNHDLENVERALGNVLDRVSVLENGENATLKRLAETETKLEWARMERDMAERRLHVSQGWNKRFYMEMVRIRAVPKLPSDDEDTER
ncbi:hypothetical protein Tco_0749880 [Tanacetum coccineum]|uniref:Uncharacterized protein n=1 Tax=Tanacetum coccineum TaxID=301880 RepID=A0ABQ4YZS0_9ASTR